MIGNQTNASLIRKQTLCLRMKLQSLCFYFLLSPFLEPGNIDMALSAISHGITAFSANCCLFLQSEIFYLSSGFLTAPSACGLNFVVFSVAWFLISWKFFLECEFWQVEAYTVGQSILHLQVLQLHRNFSFKKKGWFPFLHLVMSVMKVIVLFTHIAGRNIDVSLNIIKNTHIVCFR